MQDLCRCPQILWAHKDFYHVDVEGLVYLVSFSVSDFYTLPPSSIGFPEAWGEGFDGDTPFRVECSKVSHFCVMSASEPL